VLKEGHAGGASQETAKWLKNNTRAMRPGFSLIALRERRFARAMAVGDRTAHWQTTRIWSVYTSIGASMASPITPGESS
jgi:hypothetical protein